MSKKVIVYHRAYGCDTGCCGHAVMVGDQERFEFDHPRANEDLKAYAEKLITDLFGAEHVADLDWENCNVTDNECY